jgi:uncharacterized protein YdeI (YjbR/CyaY-like superfamily)
MEPVYFPSPEDMRDWLVRHGDDADELLVGFWRTSTGRAGLTWPQSVDEALCAGWIDGIRRKVDDERYTVRFTPRRPSSNWSAVNLARAEQLIAEGRMRPAGLRAFEARVQERTGTYSYEQRPPELQGEYAEEMRGTPAAWQFFNSQPPSYRRAAIWWVVSAKKEETRRRRLATLIEDCAHGRRLAMLRRRDQ